MTHEDLLSNILQETLSNNGPLHYFYRLAYGLPVDGSYFNPDVNGYCLIYLSNPKLSGYGDVSLSSNLVSYCAVDFTPPTNDVQSSEVSSRVGGVPYATELSIQDQCSINYFDNSTLDIFKFHNLWINYIDDVTRGEVSPSSSYISSEEECIIDYMASAYIVKFKPTVSFTSNDIVYIGKATGIFPITIPDKELIGSRNANEISMLPITYKCTCYNKTTLNDKYSWILDDFIEQFNFTLG